MVEKRTQRIPLSGSPEPDQRGGLRSTLFDIIFGAETPAGFAFDIGLLIAIVLSVAGVCLQTVPAIQETYGPLLTAAEWVFTIFFTIEYLLRLYCVQRPWRYATSFFGIVDLLAFLPSYIFLIMSGTPTFVVVRAFRLLRVFRIMKLVWFMNEAVELFGALLQARGKIVVFLGVIVIAITIAGTLMYEIETYSFAKRQAEQTAAGQTEPAEFGTTVSEPPKENKFSSIPQSMYWATVTMTTVGYGDIVPTTAAGKFVSALLILLGYSMIIVPTGFVSAELIEAKKRSFSNQACPACLAQGHDRDAAHCKYCGESLNDQS